MFRRRRAQQGQKWKPVNADARVDRTDSQVQSCDVSEKRLRRVRDALFVDAETRRVNCGSCGKEVLVKLEDMREVRTIDCQACSLTASAPASQSAERRFVDTNR